MLGKSLSTGRRRPAVVDFPKPPPQVVGAVCTILGLYFLGFILQGIDALKKHRAAKKLLKRRPL